MKHIEDLSSRMKPYFTQGQAVQEALELLFSQVGEIPSRPDSLKRKEARRTGRKVRGAKSSGNDIFS